MLKEISWLFFLINSIVFWNSCKQGSARELMVISTEFDNKFHFCDLIINDSSYGIKSIRKYSNGFLYEYEGCASEGLFTIILDEETELRREDKNLKELKITRLDSSINYFKLNLKIMYEHSDTILARSKKNETYIFVGKL